MSNQPRKTLTEDQQNEKKKTAEAKRERRAERNKLNVERQVLGYANANEDPEPPLF